MPSLITGCILARNEEARIEDALRSLLGWTDEILLLDDGSTDRTVEIALRYGARVVSVRDTEPEIGSGLSVVGTPEGVNVGASGASRRTTHDERRSPCFDAKRNAARFHAAGEWVYFLDADERVPAELGRELRRLVEERGGEFDAVVIAFRHFFCGKWMEHSGWWPGFCRAQLLRKTNFHYNSRLHSGVQVDGRTVFFPPDPRLAVTHLSYRDVTHYLGKLAAYTYGEGQSLLEDGADHSWQAMLAHFVRDWQVYYDRNRADLDGMHGFELAFMSAFYRFASRAHLWDFRRQRGELAADEPVPANLREALQFMAHVAQHGAEPYLAPGVWGLGPGDSETKGVAASSAPSHSARRAPHSALEAPPHSQTPTLPYCPGGHLPRITAIILARNEAHRIEPSLQCLQGWVSQILLVDDGSTDDTAEIARRYGARVIPVTGESQHPRKTDDARADACFDGRRSLALPHVTGDWILVMDADERIPGPLAEELVRLVRERGAEFDAFVPPFRNFFCGQWITGAGWGYSYLYPKLVRRGHLTFSSRLHACVRVEGRQHHLPSGDPERAVVHDTCPDIPAYLDKLNRYTDLEAVSLREEGARHDWRSQLAHFAHEWHLYYDQGAAHRDGMHGFVLSFLSAFYRFTARAKLWDLRRQQGELPEQEEVPASLREMLELMDHVIQHGPGEYLGSGNSQNTVAGNIAASVPPAQPVPPAVTTDPIPHPYRPQATRPHPILWRAPLLDPSGYADEARQFVLGLLAAGEDVAVAVEPWGGGEAGISPAELALLRSRQVSPDAPALIHVHQTLVPLVQPSPRAVLPVARTMYETDRLPAPWVDGLNRQARVWVPSEFNRETFVRSGVHPDKLAVIPGALDCDRFAAPVEPWPLPYESERRNAWKSERPDTGSPHSVSSASHIHTSTQTTSHRPYTFLTVFDWTLHKGWDVLLEAFAREFGADPAVRLLVKTWSSNHYTLDDIRAQADAHLRVRLGRGLDAFPNVLLWEEKLPAPELPRLYRAVDCFVLPTRGEGWGRPLMEAMASGLPTIATAWSAVTDFHDAEVGYPLPYRLEPVSEAGAREIPPYRGHCWAEPNREALQRLMRHVLEHPEEARARGAAARARIQERYSRSAVTRVLQTELDYCTKLAAMSRRSPEMEHGCSRIRRTDTEGLETSQASLVPHSTGALDLPHPQTPTPPYTPLCASASLRETPSPQTSANPLNPCKLVSHPPAQPRLTPPFLPKANPLAREPAPEVDFREVLGRSLRVRWEGDQALLSSLALVNRELCLGLLSGQDVELSLGEQTTPWHALSEQDDPRFAGLFALRGRPLAGPPDVTIRHHFPPDWSRPEHGKLIVIQPWEYGHLPAAWVAGAAQADEIWVYSRWVRDVYVRSGVPAEKVHLLPLGFDPTIFTPEGPRLHLPSRSPSPSAPQSPDPQPPFRFLFVGGALDRKGADLLLAAYRHAFRPEDPVSLVVKDMGTRTFYRGATFAEDFRRAAADPACPEVLYVDDDLTPTELAALYRSCHCLVLPYRGEGFALPALEAMACGVMPIVTGGGPTDDFIAEGTALRLPAGRKYLGRPGVGYQDQFVCVGDPWQLEPDPGELVRALRTAYHHAEETRRRGHAAAESVRDAWTWHRSAADLRARLRELLAPAPVETRLQARPWELEGTDGGNEGGNGPDAPVHPEPRVGGLWSVVRGPAENVTGAAPTRICDPRSPDPTPNTQYLTPNTISLCMIVRNEEPRLRECLESIRPYVDELVVVDTGSTDRTREIATACGARVFELPWPESFAVARNASLDLARGAWIFWMDADDVISPECGRSLRELVRRCPGRNAAFQVQVRIPPGPGEFSASVVDHVKLFPNRPDLRFEHRIHEQILPAARAAGLDVIFSDLYVTHRNYDRSEAGQATKRRRDFRLLELDLRDRPDHPFTLFNLGMTYLHAAKEFEVAAHYLRRSLDGSHPADSIVRKAYAMLVTCRICQGDWEAAIQANEEGRTHYPEDAELLFQAGQLYQQVGRFAEGRLCLERLLQGEDDPHYRSVDVGLRTYRGLHELALLYRRMGDGPHCARVLRDLAARQPEYLPAQVDLVETLHGLGKREEARSLLERIPAVKGVAEELRRLRALPWDGVLALAPASGAPDAPAEAEADPRHFRFRGERLPYFVHPYNGAGSNERSVEVALALKLLAETQGPVLEVGHVLGHYGAQGHAVVDRYEAAPGVLNEDIAAFRPAQRYGLVVSVSTLEHVGLDEPERDPGKAIRVLRHLTDDLLLPGGKLLVTVPLGYNPELDRAIRAGETGTDVAFLRRINAENEWEEVPSAEVGEARYDHPFPHGNVLAVLTR